MARRLVLSGLNCLLILLRERDALTPVGSILTSPRKMVCSSPDLDSDGTKPLNVNGSGSSSDTFVNIDSFKYLGVLLDTHLGFHNHVSTGSRKVKSCTHIVYFLCWVCNCITESLANHLHHS